MSPVTLVIILLFWRTVGIMMGCSTSGDVNKMLNVFNSFWSSTLMYRVGSLSIRAENPENATGFYRL